MDIIIQKKKKKKKRKQRITVLTRMWRNWNPPIFAGKNIKSCSSCRK
jgi:hypothetical protein